MIFADSRIIKKVALAAFFCLQMNDLASGGAAILMESCIFT